MQLTMERITGPRLSKSTAESQGAEGPWKKGSMVHQVEEGQWGEQSGTGGDGIKALDTHLLQAHGGVSSAGQLQRVVRRRVTMIWFYKTTFLAVARMDRSAFLSLFPYL